MNGPWAWMVLTAGEALLVILLLLLVSWLRNLAARRRDRKAIQELVTGVKASRSQRRDQISAFLSERFGLNGEVLQRATRGVNQAELTLIQAFANIYLQRDAAAAAGFHRRVETGVEPYWELSGDGMAQAMASLSAPGAEEEPVPEPAVSEHAPEDIPEDPELTRLRGENVRLSEELRVTMDTMSRMLNEYSTIFSKDTDVRGITVLDEEGDLPGEADSEPGIEADVPRSLPPETTTAAADQTEVPFAESEGPLDDLDPDAILAAAQSASTPASPEDDGADGAAGIDPAMMDLSLDDGPSMDAKETQTERQRIIDAES